MRHSRCFLVPVALSAIAICGGLLNAAEQKQPNVIVILSDDQGWGDLSINGNKNLTTPHIDQLVRDGASFDRFFVCPVCSPTRAEFLTGRYHPHSGVYSTSAGGERMDLDEATIADSFKAAGYATAAFGKWHNGMQFPYHPNARGFHEFYGFCSGHWGNYFSPMLERNGQIVKGKGFVIDDFTNHAIEFIQENRNKPFFVYLPFNTPHSPMQVPDRWWNHHKDQELTLHNRDPRRENLQHIRAAMAMCENIDWNVGRILQALRELKLENDTIVVYFCDNGPNGVRWNGDMKGRKGSTDEGGVRSPLIIRWPGNIPTGHQIPNIASVTDLLPTLTGLAGIRHVGTKPLDGMSLQAHLMSRSPQPTTDRMIFSHWRNRVSVRTQRFRLDNNGRLYDIKADPGQRKDVSRKHPKLTARLKQAVSNWRADVLDGYDTDERPFLLGHPASRFTQVPARDGTAHGKIKRSNRFPNCSYFANWTDRKDSITWTAEVAQAGRYQVDLYYACPKKDVGSTIELSFQDAKLQATIETPHDPPLVGAAEDRVRRTESYVKDFRPMKMGVIDLPMSKGTLTLKAITKPGEQVMEFRMLLLTRVE